MPENVILIIGNGFDKACGLPSRYTEFYKNRFRKSDSLKNIHSVLTTLIADEKHNRNNDINFVFSELYALLIDDIKKTVIKLKVQFLTINIISNDSLCPLHER